MTAKGAPAIDAAGLAQGARLDDKIVIVTGAAGGIGACIAKHFAAAGATLLLADIQADHATAIAQEIAARGGRAASTPVDITDPDSARAMAAIAMRDYGRIDVLVACAGIDAPRGQAWSLADAHWRNVIDTDLSGAWWCAKAVIPSMIRARSGRMIFIGSVAGRRGSLGTSVAYNAAKAGIAGLTFGLARQLEPHGILVNAVAPGPTGNTGEPMTDEEKAREAATYPLGLGGPEPVAHACLYLAGQGGNWISGTVLNVSGGRWQG
ncbi:MAG: SDR family oxidoreductase [Bradyrhizobium sp.]|uniref:SDR family NAD(P)-dependent oxidoreductase n=1 Tax=Bradyrhizobium sp. TaxID=376 RepID=UPI001DA9BE35|nr:SDR family NAD(P)-dependent oxidoreductase [Bradyrhizobium sp.]MBV9562260.1 SDR family oxidoreductase [Bradyrhizobium sp.]